MLADSSVVVVVKGTDTSHSDLYLRAHVPCGFVLSLLFPILFVCPSSVLFIHDPITHFFFLLACYHLGGGHLIHDLMWMQIDGDRKHICDQCGQFFKLHQIADEAEWESLPQETKDHIFTYYAGKLDLPTDLQGHEPNILEALHPGAGEGHGHEQPQVVEAKKE